MYRSLLRVEELTQRVDVAAEVVVLAHLPFDLLAAVEDGRVVATTEGLAESPPVAVAFLRVKGMIACAGRVRARQRSSADVRSMRGLAMRITVNLDDRIGAAAL